MNILRSSSRIILPATQLLLLSVTVAAGWLLFFDRTPFLFVAVLTRAFALHVLILSVLAALVLARALHTGRRVTSVIAALTIVLSTTIALIPTIVAARHAGTSANIGEYFANSLKPNMGGPDLSKTVHYATVDGFKLNMDVWPSAIKNSKKAMLLIHGGAWKRGYRGSLPEWNRMLSNLGFTVFDIEYRMVGDLPPGGAAQATVEDSKCALAWITANAAMYGIDPNRISVMGQSAGGHLALMTAYTSGTESFRPSCDLPEGKIKAVVDIYGPTDLVDFAEGPESTDVSREIANDVFGGTVQEKRAAYWAFSPVAYLRSDLPPTLSIHGATDHLVPASQTRRLVAGLSKAGVPHEVVYLPFSDHIFDINWGSYQTQEARKAVAAFLSENG